MSEELGPAIRQDLFRIATGSRIRQNHYLPRWEPNQTYGRLQPGHQLNLAALQNHMADLIVLTDWMPKLLERIEELERENEALHIALKASGERRERLREALELVEPHLSLLRHRGVPPWVWGRGSPGLPPPYEVDAAIGKARKVLGW